MPDPTRAGRRANDNNPQSKAVNFGVSWFFGIGIDDYEHFSKLKNAVKDVKDVYQILSKDYDIDEDHAVLLLNEQATEDNIISQLENLITKVEPQDKLLIYYSGHGYLNASNRRGAWVPVDAKTGALSQYIRNSTIREYIKDINSFHTLLISDACFSGSLLVTGSTRSSFTHLEEMEQMRSRWAICSGRNNEEVSDGKPGKNSPFTGSIIQVLKRNKNRLFNVAKLSDKVLELTRGKYNQLPMSSPLVDSGHEGGQYIFKRNVDDRDIWLFTAQTNTIQAYSDYLLTFPKGAFATEATKAIQVIQDDETWLKFSRENNPKSYQQYLNRFPDGQFIEPANRLLSFEEEPDFAAPTPAIEEEWEAAALPVEEEWEEAAAPPPFASEMEEAAAPDDDFDSFKSDDQELFIEPLPSPRPKPARPRRSRRKSSSSKKGTKPAKAITPSKPSQSEKKSSPPPKKTTKPAKADTSFCVLLDAGHGGLSPQGVYGTKGKYFDHGKDEFHNDGMFYEGVFNRQILERVADRLADYNIPFKILSHDYIDTSLSARVTQANTFADQYEKSLLISFHANAGGGNARGNEIYISDMASPLSRSYAKTLEAEFKKTFKKRIRFRGIKEARFYLLTRTEMPAVLVEHLFYDNYEDALLMMDEKTQSDFTEAQVSAILTHRKALLEA